VHRDVTQPPRLGLAIAKKRAKRAVDRNKLKRVARECFRTQMGLLAGIQLVVMNRDAAATADKPTVRAALLELLEKAARG